MTLGRWLNGTCTAKLFGKAVSSFALVPSSHDTPLTSNVMVVTKDGDLELYALHDTPTHTPWSARGDLALGIGKSYTIIPGLHEPDPPPEPWELTAQSYPLATPRSMQRPLLHDDAAARGRYGAPLPATFGRGDEDGFPPLAGSARESANLSATRPGSRMLSPAGWKNKYFEHTAPVKRAIRSAASPARAESLKAKRRSMSRKNRDTSPMWGNLEASAQHGVENDISMTMRKRVVQGYGLVNVSVVASDLCLNKLLTFSF